MQPTLYTNDVLILERISVRLQKLEKGDIVISKCPNNPKQNICKRIVGLPGDKIRNGFTVTTVSWQDMFDDFLCLENYLSNFTRILFLRLSDIWMLERDICRLYLYNYISCRYLMDTFGWKVTTDIILQTRGHTDQYLRDCYVDELYVKYFHWKI